MNSFAGGWQRAGKLAIDGPASVLVRERRGGRVDIAVSDPTMDRARVAVVVQGRPLRRVEADDGSGCAGCAAAP